jgi:predicted aconitase
MALELTTGDRAMLEAREGEACALAMRIVVEMANVWEADRLIDITSAHVDGCLYHGLAGLEFAERLVAGGAEVRVPTTLNVSSLDLLHPALVRLDAETSRNARRLMDAYVAMGCQPTWTCAPYQLDTDRTPAFGEHIAWAESNAIVYANSVIGARTNRYGDFIDVCAAITGRVPAAGLHVDENRRARIVFRLTDDVPQKLLHDDVLGAVIGHIVGKGSGDLVPVIVGLPTETSADALKALGAAAASSGAVAMFHAVGITPEARTLDVATRGTAPDREIAISLADLRSARDDLTTTPDRAIAAVSIGTPHASMNELRDLDRLSADLPPKVPFYVNTWRGRSDEIELSADLGERFAERGFTFVYDTCTYVTPIMHDISGPVMTNSAKWAWYAPSNLGFDVVFGSLEECVRSAAIGRVWRDPELWGDDA